MFFRFAGRGSGGVVPLPLRPTPPADRVRDPSQTERPSLLTILHTVAQRLLDLYWWAVILAALVQTLVSFGVLDTRNRLVWSIGDFLYRITEPALRRIRRFVPFLGGIDLSFIVLLLLIYVVKMVLARVYAAILFGDVQGLFL